MYQFHWDFGRQFVANKHRRDIGNQHPQRGARNHQQRRAVAVSYTHLDVYKRQLVARLRKLEEPRLVVEATGGYEDALLEACCDAGLWICRVNPRQARDFARATGELATVPYTHLDVYKRQA